MASNGMHAQERLVYVTPETLKKQVELVLSAWGMMSEKVELIADLLVETDLRGIESHGASMLPLYDKMRRGDLANVKVGRGRLITRQHLRQFPGIAS